jgi:hypothetical protein
VSAVSISADTVVLLGRVAPLADDALYIEGVATTKHRHSKEVPLSAGLVRVDGGLTTWTPGLLPNKVRVELPIPLFWNHELDRKIGEVFALGATDLALHFRACIAPPGTAGYDSELQSRVWRNVCSGKALAASIGVRRAPTSDGSWRLDELSVCVASSNRFARITKIRTPDGEVLEFKSQPITLEAMRLEWEEAHKQTTMPAQRLQELVADLRRATPELGTVDGMPSRLKTIGKKIGKITRDAAGNATIEITEMAEAYGGADPAQVGDKPTTRAEGTGTARTQGTPLTYCDVWRDGIRYTVGNMVTHKGALWHCRADKTTDRPGTSHDWKLMHKSIERAS